MKNRLKTLAMVIGCLLLTVVSAKNVLGQQTAEEFDALVSQYVAALQGRDYKTIVELNDGSRLEEKQHKVRRPEIRWPRLIAEFRQRKIMELKSDEDERGAQTKSDHQKEHAPGVITPAIAQIFDLRKEINEPLSLLPLESTWAIGEIRPGIDMAGHRFSTISCQ